MFILSRNNVQKKITQETEKAKHKPLQTRSLSEFLKCSQITVFVKVYDTWGWFHRMVYNRFNSPNYGFFLSNWAVSVQYVALLENIHYRQTNRQTDNLELSTIKIKAQ